MPVNLRVEFAKAQERFLNAKTREEKISALEDMIRACPKHKGTENLLAQLKTKLAKLKKQTSSRKRGKPLIKKEGDAQVCLIGLPNSGKSTLLNLLTNANAKVSDIPYTTTSPQIGTMDYEGVKIQIVEIPSTFRKEHMSIAHTADGIVLLARNKSEERELEDTMERFNLKKPFCIINETSRIKEKIWQMLGLVRVYTKEPGKKPEDKPLILKKGAKVKDAVEKIHKDFLKYFRFARIWPGKYPGEKVGLNYQLKDGDILEVHLK